MLEKERDSRREACIFTVNEVGKVCSKKDFVSAMSDCRLCQAGHDVREMEDVRDVVAANEQLTITLLWRAVSTVQVAPADTVVYSLTTKLS